MKLQNKLSLVLLTGLLAVYAGSCLVQRYLSLRQIETFAGASRDDELNRQWQWVGCVQQATGASLVNAMAEGDMDKFEKILVAQRNVPGLQELALFDGKGRRAYSSIPNAGKFVLPENFRAQLLSSTNLVKNRTDESFEIYHPLRAENSCVSCHTDWKPEQFCGTLAMRFSADSLKKAESSWATFQTDFSRTNFITAISTMVVLMIVLATLVLTVIFFQVTKPLKRVAARLMSQSTEVAVAARQMATASQWLADGSSRQAASLEETSASLEELSATTKSNSDNAHKANSLAQQTRGAADQGANDIQTMNKAMNTIKNSSDDIAKIIKTIDEIAFQTNILALNAAVEAARAGEVGLGFAVVAEEVRNLAQRSAQAAKETAAKIANAISNTSQGVQISGKVSTALDEIVIRARQLDELAAEVANASGEQSRGITQINSAVSEMDKVTQTNAATAEEAAASAKQLNMQASAMKDAVTDLLQLVSTVKPEKALVTQTAAGQYPTIPRPTGRFPIDIAPEAAEHDSHAQVIPDHRQAMLSACSDLGAGAECQDDALGRRV